MATARADSLTWDVTADVGRFGEAIDFFSKRVVMTRDDALAIDLDSRKRAFWIGGGLQLTQVQRIFDEIGKALESGEDYAAFRKRVLADVAIKSGHLDTVFRNATQRSYNAGRWEQMQAAKALRPYVMFDAVLDDRSSDICGTKIDGKICSIDDPFLKTNSPQRHHRCRTGLRSVRAKDAERRGITPREELDAFPPAAPGFGQIASDAPVWKPDRRKHDAKLVEELEAKEKPRKRKPKPKKPPPEHDPAHWEAEYRKPSKLAPNGYGDAAPALAWGRAMLERGLDRPPLEILAELKRLQAAGHPALKGAGFHNIERADWEGKTLRQTLTGEYSVPHFVALAEHSLTIKRGATFETFDKGTDVVEAARFFEQSLDASVTHPGVRLVRRPGRAEYNLGSKIVYLEPNGPTKTAVHELSHAIEDFDPRALRRSVAFLRARTAGQATKRLADLHPGSGYWDWEVTIPDDFISDYIGKDYKGVATEVTSMGYETMAKPFGLEDLWERDRDFLMFLLGQLAGR
jgi:SPP1 gp7 family putative phage head morphogenesis protein